MGAFITGLLSQVTLANLWDQIAPAAPFIGTAILLGLGYFILRRSIGGVARGKAKI